MRVSLIGNPNTGKTTLFNTLTGAKEHVGNWHGVTVEEKNITINYRNTPIEIVDLPGIYSLSSLSFEEKVATDYLLSHKNDVVVNICDYNNLQRNLYLTLGLMELGANIIVAVNQIEKKRLRKIDLIGLEKQLGIRVLSIDASNKSSVEKLKQEILSFQHKNYCLPYIKKLPLQNCYNLIDKNNMLKDFFAIKMLEDDENIKAKFNLKNNFNGSEIVAKARYDYIDKILNLCVSKDSKIYGQSKIDKIVLNKFLALPIFLLVMACVFYLTFFSVGAFLSDGLAFLLEKFISNPLLNWIGKIVGTSSWIYGFFDSAIFGGVGSVLSFLPQVALLFVFLSILEDSGYLARVAFVFEDILSKVGLSGKSVYTLLMGFGCSTTAILTARNMEDKNAKIKTALLTPYMSCSAKFPIYVCIGGAFFGASNIFVIMGLYILGVIVAVTISMIYEKTILKSKEQSFILEFPPYRSVSAKQLIGVFFKNVKLFLVRVGTLIITMNVIIWVLSNFSFTFQYVNSAGGESILQCLGRIFAPIFIPLGFGSWGLVSALIAGLIAKEVIVSSIMLFNNVNGGADEFALSIKDANNPVFFASSASVISYLVFCLLYFPCLASMGVLSKEIGKKWMIFGAITQFVIAYFVAMFFYNLVKIFNLLGTGYFLLLVFAVLSILISIIVIVKKIKRNKVCIKNCENCSKHCTKKLKGE